MRYISIGVMGPICLALTACQPQSPQALRSDASLADDNPATAPLVEIFFNGFNPETTTLRFSEGETIAFKIGQITTGVETTSLAQVLGPTINFGTMSGAGEESNGDLDVGRGVEDIRFTLQDVEGPREAIFDRFSELTVEFQAPSVTSSTDLAFQFRSSGPAGSRIRNIPITIEDNASAITLNGQVSKGLVKNTEIRLFSVDSFALITDGLREIVDPVQIDETGTYNFTILPATDLEELLRFEVKGDGADMICDAPRGCNEFAFGETFEVEDDLDLRALVEVPQLGQTRVANVNILTTLATKRAGQLNSFRRVSPGNLRDGQEDVASVLGITEQDFSTLPFVDITAEITSFDVDAVRAAMIGGGILGATFLHSDPDDDEDYLEELDDFIDEFGDRQVFCRDDPSQNTISVEDIMSQALEIAELNGDLLSQNYFLGRVNDIRNGAFTCDFVTPAVE